MFESSCHAPPGPDWGWRTEFDTKDGDSFRIAMYNVPPGGEEELAFEAAYKRRSATEGGRSR